MVLERVLEAWMVVMIVTMTAIVVFAVIWRKSGASFIWYDEVAAILLAWITYYGAALAALKRAHIGFDGILLALPMRWRMLAVVDPAMLAEAGIKQRAAVTGREDVGDVGLAMPVHQDRAFAGDRRTAKNLARHDRPGGNNDEIAAHHVARRNDRTQQ